MQGQGQNIIEVGFNVQQFTEEKNAVVSGMKEVVQTAQNISPELKKVFESLVAINNTKIQTGSTGGIAELKAQIAALTKEVANLKKANEELASSQKTTDVITKMGVESKTTAESIKSVTGSMRENIAQQLEYKNRLTEISGELKKLRKDREDLRSTEGNEQAIQEIDKKIQGYVEEQTHIKAISKELEKQIQLQAKAAVKPQAQPGVVSPISGSSEAGAPSKEAIADIERFSEEQLALLNILSQNEIRTKQLSAAKKELAQQYRDGAIGLDTYREKLALVNGEQKEIGATNKTLNLALNNMAKETINAEGTLEKMKATLELTKLAYSKLNDAEKNSDIGKALQEKSKALSDDINRQKISMGDYTSNIGRYAESLGPLFTKVGEEISKLKAKQDDLNKSYQGLSAADQAGPAGTAMRSDIEQTGRAINDLNEIQKASLQTNQSAASTISTLERSYVNMAAGGHQSEQFLKEFKEVIVQVKQQVQSYHSELNKKPNAGNFTNAINILQKSLADAKTKLASFTTEEQKASAAGQQAAQEVQLLTELVGQQSVGFNTLAREVMNTGKALETMASQGLQNTEAFKALEHEYAEAVRKLHDFRQEQKIITDSAPKLAALTAAAKGLGGIYAAGAGAAALFAGGNEKVEKELQKLVAVMTLLQGLNEVHELLEKKNAIATTLFGTSVTGTTVALEGEAVAAEEAAVATGTFGKALAFIQANPILIAFTVLAAAVTAFALSERTASADVNKLNDALKAQNEAVQENINLIKGTYADKIEELNKKLSEADKRGENDAVKFGIKKQITEANIELANKEADAQIDAYYKIGQVQKTALQQSQEYYLKKSQLGQIDEAGNKIPEFKPLVPLQQVETNNKIIKSNDDLTKNVTTNVITQTEKIDILKKARDDYHNRVKSDLEDEAALESQIAGKARKGKDTENLEKKIEAVRKRKEMDKSYYEGYATSIEKLNEADKDHADLQQEMAKYSSDELRKIVFATTQFEVQQITDKNNAILANERSTHEQRLEALRSNTEEAKRLAKAELVNVVGDKEKGIPGDRSKSVNDRIAAEKDYQTKIKGIDIEGNAQRLKENTDYNNKILAAKYDVMKSETELDANKNSEISKDANQSLEIRLGAYKKYVQDQADLIEADQRYQVITKELTDEELIALDTETKNKLLELTKKSHSDIKAIQEEARQEQNKKFQVKSDIATGDITNEYDEKHSKLLELFAEGVLTQKQYNKESLKLEAEKQIALLNYEIYTTSVLLEQQKERLKNAKAEFDAEMELAEARANLISDPDKKKKALDDIGAARDKEKNIELDRANEITKSEQKIAAIRIKLADTVAQFIKKTSDGSKQDFADVFKNIVSVAQQVGDVIGGILDASVERQKNRIQELIDKNNEYAQAETERINNSTLNEQDKAARLIQLQATVDQKNKQYAREQKDQDIRKAKFDKASTVAKIVEETALAIIKVLADYPGPPGFALAAITGAIGAAQLATALAAPIPTYAEGAGIKDKPAHRGGRAVVGERKDRVPELVQEPSGKSYVVSKPTFFENLPKGSRVIPLTTYGKQIIYNESLDRVAERTVFVNKVKKEVSNQSVTKMIGYVPRQMAMNPLTSNQVNDNMYSSMIVNTVEKINTVKSMENKSDDAWRIAKWQVKETKKALEGSTKKQPINITNKMDLDHAAWINKYVYGKY